MDVNGNMNKDEFNYKNEAKKQVDEVIGGLQHKRVSSISDNNVLAINGGFNQLNEAQPFVDSVIVGQQYHNLEQMSNQMTLIKATNLDPKEFLA